MEAKIVQATIQPIKADEIKMGKILLKYDNIFTPEFETLSPLKVTPETLKHALKCAIKITENIDQLPHTEEAGDLLALAFSVIHYANLEEMKNVKE